MDSGEEGGGGGQELVNAKGRDSACKRVLSARRRARTVLDSGSDDSDSDACDGDGDGDSSDEVCHESELSEAESAVESVLADVEGKGRAGRATRGRPGSHLAVERRRGDDSSGDRDVFNLSSDVGSGRGNEGTKASHGCRTPRVMANTAWVGETPARRVEAEVEVAGEGEGEGESEAGGWVRQWMAGRAAAADGCSRDLVGVSRIAQALTLQGEPDWEERCAMNPHVLRCQPPLLRVQSLCCRLPTRAQCPSTHLLA